MDYRKKLLKLKRSTELRYAVARRDKIADADAPQWLISAIDRKLDYALFLIEDGLSLPDLSRRMEYCHNRAVYIINQAIENANGFVSPGAAMPGRCRYLDDYRRNASMIDERATRLSITK
jgi:hypothetical protein